MAAYRVFQKNYATNSEKAFGDDIKFVREGFAVLAFLFPAIWLLINRLWLAFAVYCFTFFCVVLFSIHYSPLIYLFLNNMLGLYIAFEGRNFIASKLGFLGYQEVDLINASDLEEAEARFFNNHQIHYQEDGKGDALSEKYKKMSTGRQAFPKKAPLIGGFPTASRG